MVTEFEWDPSKAATNLAKHGVAFEDAIRVFADINSIVELDRIADGEARWKAIGIVERNLVLVVIHTTQEKDTFEVIRIISAREANRKERRAYENQNG